MIMSNESNRIQVSKGDARWFGAWKKRIESGKPREGDYNFVLFQGPDGVIYDPPADGSEPAVFSNGKWEVLVQD